MTLLALHRTSKRIYASATMIEQVKEGLDIVTVESKFNAVRLEYIKLEFLDNLCVRGCKDLQSLAP